MRHIYHGYNAGTFVIHIDSFEKEILSGRFLWPDREGIYEFENLMQLLMKLEQCLEESNEPQAFTMMRSFLSQNLSGMEGKEEVFLGKGKVASFHVQIMFRRNASWQGSVIWTEEGEKRNFRSALELVFLINSALSERQSFVQMINPQRTPALLE